MFVFKRNEVPQAVGLPQWQAGFAPDRIRVALEQDVGGGIDGERRHIGWLHARGPIQPETAPTADEGFHLRS